MADIYIDKKLYSLDDGSVFSLIERYRYPLLYFATGYTGDLAAAEDIVQDAILKLLVKKPKFYSESALKVYLYSATKHAAIDFLRKVKRKKKYIETAKRFTRSEKEQIEDAAFASAVRQEMAHALACLSKEYCETLYLHYFEELKIEEIAKIEGKNKKQIYNLLSRAKKALAEIYKKEGNAE